MLTSTGNDPTHMETAVRRMIERRVEGVAIMTFGMEEVLLEDLKLRKVPLVFRRRWDRPVPGSAIFASTTCTGFGRRCSIWPRCATSRSPSSPARLHLKSAQARKQAFLSSMAEIGLEVDPALMVEGTHTIEGGIDRFGQAPGRIDPADGRAVLERHDRDGRDAEEPTKKESGFPRICR